MPYLEETYDIVVVGAGHAGCEAALACARLGLETIVFTVINPTVKFGHMHHFSYLPGVVPVR